MQKRIPLLPTFPDLIAFPGGGFTNAAPISGTAALHADFPAAVALTLLGTLTGFGPGGSAITVDLTSLGLQDGDLVRVAVMVASNANRTVAMTTSGYTALFSPKVDTADTYRVSANVFEKVMGVSPDGNVVVSSSGSNGSPCVVIVKAYRGARVSPTTDLTPVKSQANNSIVADPPTNTPVTAGTIIEYWGCGARVSGTTDIYTSGDITDLVSGYHDHLSHTNAWFYGSILWTSGAVDPAALTIAGSDATMSCACLTSTVSPA